MTKMFFKNLLLALILTLTFMPLAYSAQVYDTSDEFIVIVNDESKLVYNDNIKTSYSFIVENTLVAPSQYFQIKPKAISGFKIDLSQESFRLREGESQEVVLTYTANSAFDYSNKVVSSNVIKISQDENYIGDFDLPVTIYGKRENVTLNFGLKIDKKEKSPLDFSAKLASDSISPVSPLKFSINAENLENKKNVSVRVYLDDNEIMNFDEVFSKTSSYKIFTKEISNLFDPKIYNAKIVMRIDDNGKAEEWFDQFQILLAPNENVVSIPSFEKSIFKDTYRVSLENKGNVQAVYEDKVEVNTFKNLFFSSNEEYVRDGNFNKYSLNLEKGESKTIVYSFNYLPLYLLFLVLIVLLTYMYVRLSSNPLDIETRLYEIKKVSNEGVKSFKVRIGFENIKVEEIDDLKVVFRMPSYLKVKDDSFLLAPPKHALKGRDQFKLVWEFKRFEKNDSRILGFQLMNNRGILGDVKLPPLEIEVKVKGKIRKYYEIFPIIKG